MTKPCTNYLGCSAYTTSVQRGQNTCTGCGANVGTVSNAADQAIDSLVSRVDHVTVEHFFSLLNDAAGSYVEALKRSGVEDVSMSEAAFAITYRAIQTISDLREAISKHG